MTKEIFATICYLVLMNHHGQGYIEAHPTYIQEKLSMLNAGFDAYGYLDRPNQLDVIRYFEHWKLELPEEIKEYEEEAEQALKNYIN